MPALLGCTWAVQAATKDALGWAAVVAVLGLFLSPVKDIWGPEGAFKNNSTEKLATGFPYFASFFNCVLWIFYALADLPRLLQPLVINLIGASLHLSFLTVYWKNAKDEADARSCLLAFLGGLATLGGAATLATIRGDATPFGNAAMVVNVIMYYSPLAALGTVLKERSVAKMPFAPLLMTFIGSSLWLSFGTYIFDWPIIIPNAIGVCFGVLQLVLYAHVAAGERKRASADGTAGGAAPAAVTGHRATDAASYAPARANRTAKTTTTKHRVQMPHSVRRREPPRALLTRRAVPPLAGRARGGTAAVNAGGRAGGRWVLL